MLCATTTAIRCDMPTALDTAPLHSNPTTAMPAACLFVDIARFIALAEAQGSEAAAGMAARLRAEVEALLPSDNAGIVEAIGDAIIVRMADPAQAIAVGLCVANEASGALWTPAVHVGIHYGPPVERLGDFYGMSVDIAARIADLAGENEVLITQALKDAAGELEGVELEDCGAQLLRHVESPVQVYAARQVVAAGTAGSGGGEHGAGSRGLRQQSPLRAGERQPPDRGAGGDDDGGHGEGGRQGGERGPRRLFRSRRKRMIAGIAGGLGRYFNTDPIMFRIVLLALALFGGVGVLLYLIAWILIPQESAPGQRTPSRRATGRRAALLTGIALLLLGALVLLYKLLSVAFTETWPLIATLVTPVLIALCAGSVWLWLGHRQSSRLQPSSPDIVVGRRIAFGVSVIAALIALALISALAAGGGGGTATAVIVVALGVVMVASSAFTRRTRWLIAPAITVAISAGVMFGAHVDVRGGVGNRLYRPLSVAQLRRSYELGVGRIELDLRGVRFPSGDSTLNVRLGIGEVAVIVPRNVCVATDAHVGIGYVGALDRETGGAEVDWHNLPGPPPSVPRLVVHSNIGIGALRVADRPLAGGGSLGEQGFGESGSAAERYGTNDACFEHVNIAPRGEG